MATTRAIKIMPDGECTVVTLRGSKTNFGDPLWGSIKREMKTTTLHYNALVTKEKDAVYEFYYDDTGDWCGKHNRAAEAVTKLVWFGPCIIMKVDATKEEIADGTAIYSEDIMYIDVIDKDESPISFIFSLADLL